MNSFINNLPVSTVIFSATPVAWWVGNGLSILGAAFLCSCMLGGALLGSVLNAKSSSSSSNQLASSVDVQISGLRSLVSHLLEDMTSINTIKGKVVLAAGLATLVISPVIGVILSSVVLGIILEREYNLMDKVIARWQQVVAFCGDNSVLDNSSGSIGRS